jgi:hypothetical protein
VKYGRYGTPHIRFVYISQDEKYLVWCVKTFEIGQQQMGESVMLGVESKVKRILLRDIVDVRTGISGSPVLKKYQLPKEVDNLVLSVITRSRSLDLKANDSATRNRWVKYFNYFIQSKTLRRPPSGDQ